MRFIGKGGPTQRQASGIAELVRHAADAFGAEVALLAPGRKPLTFRGLAAQVESIAAQLQLRGIGPGDRVAVVLSGTPEMAAAILGIASVATCAPLNPAYTADEFEFHLADVGAKAVVVEAGARSPVLRVAVGRGIEILGVQPEAEAGRFRFLHSRGDRAAPRWAGPDDVALVLHTSGTTGRPKIVPLTHANLCASASNMAATLALGPADRALGILPLFHILGLVGTHLASLAAGASVVCCPGFYVTDFFGWLDEFRPTWYNAVPTIHQRILARARDYREVIGRSALRFLRSSSAPLPLRVSQELEEVFGVPVIEAYGLTETASQVACNPLPPGTRRPGTVGPAAGPRVAIMDAGGNLLPAGQLGEIVVSGPTVIKGFENDPEANRNAFASGWLRTGDQGRLDADGYLTIAGRLKEMINRGGEKIAPREVEDALLAHAAVDQAVAFAAPHPALGEDVCAAVVVRPGAQATEAELRAFLADRLAYFKVPARIVFLEEIPKGRTGKVQRLGLAQALGLVETAHAPAPATQVPAAPPTELEQSLARIWAEVLGVESVALDHNFLELGGDSMLGARLVERINARLGVDLGFVALFTTPTVAGMAEAITRARAAGASDTSADLRGEPSLNGHRPASGSSLVVLKSAGAAPPFFCVPGLNREGPVLLGNDLQLVRLARSLDPGQAFCTFQFDASAALEPESLRVEALAARFLRDLRAYQPHGPYFLGGYSFGGLVILEMARQLLAENEQVATLVLIDSNGPDYPRMRPWPERLAAHLKRMRALPAHKQLAYPLAKLWGKLAPAASQLSSGTCPARDAEPPMVRALKQSRAAYLAALRPYPSAATLLRATDHSDFPGVCFDDPYNGWRPIFQRGIEVHPINGNHHTMFDDPGLTELATALQVCLRRGQAAFS